MQAGDLIRFSKTGVLGVVTKTTDGFPEKYVHVLCGPDADGEHSGAALAFPQSYITSTTEVINEAR
jgi:hypothetical protein